MGKVEKDDALKQGLFSNWLERRRFSEVREWVRGDRLLDYGCGVGNFSQWLPKDTIYVGVERDPVIAAKGRLLHNGLQIITGDLVIDPNLLEGFINNPFDSVVMAAILEHLTQPILLLERISAVLKQGGDIIITTPMPWTEALINLGATTGLMSSKVPGEHEELFSQGDLFELLSKSGYHVTHYSRFLFGLNQIIVATKL